MNKKIYIILVGVMIFFPLVSALLEEQDVDYKLKLTFIPSCTSSCSNSSQVINGTNYTISNCFNNCTGTIYINPGEDKNHITVIQKIDEIDPVGELYTGYKTIQIGNGSDVLNVWDQLKTCTGCVNDLESCINSNRNVSVDLLVCQKDVGYETNFTECNNERTILQTGKQNIQTSLESKQKEVDDMKNQRNYWAIIAVVIGYLISTKAVPYFKNKDTPKDASEQQFPSNTGY